MRTLLSNTTYGTNHAEALGLFERALALDARAVEAQIWLALMLINRVLDFVHGFFHYDAMRPIGRHRQGLRNQLICALKVDIG